MFEFTDRRTAAERDRDLKASERRHQNDLLAQGFMGKVRKLLAQDDSLQVGLVGSGTFLGSELLVEDDGVTYKLVCSVNRD